MTKIYVVLGEISYEFCDALKAFTDEAAADQCADEFQKLADAAQKTLFDQIYDYFKVQEVELDSVKDKL